MKTKLYTEDWIGLKAMDEAGKVKYISVAGNHLGISKSDMIKYVVPYLEDEVSTKLATEAVATGIDLGPLIKGSSSYIWPPSIRSFFGDLLGVE